MNTFPLQPGLIDAVIRFANLNPMSPNQVSACFSDVCNLCSLPQNRTCRKIQREVRDWLLTSDGLGMWTQAIEGFDRRAVEFDSGIQLTGRVLHVLSVPPDGDWKPQIVWKWRFSDAPLRAICALAVATIWQEKLEEKVGVCAWDGCNNLFIDAKSRGKPRKYCTEKDCVDARNLAAVNASRGRN